MHKIRIVHTLNLASSFILCVVFNGMILSLLPLHSHPHRFINHSCQPNLETQKWLVGGRTCIGLFALSDIPSGTELTFDYQLDTLGHSKMKCHCGAENCSGFLGEKVKGRAGNVQVAEKGNGSGSKSTLKKKKIKSKRHSSASKQKEDIS